MSIPTAPAGPGSEVTPQRQGQRLTRLAYVMQLLYIPWWVVMFVAGYPLYALFDMEPGLGEDLTSKGFIGWVASILFAVVLATPSWVGAFMANRARGQGGGRRATVALTVCIAVGVALVVMFGVIWPV
jgi:hypothetical protein